ncbi:undecaprenyl-phosphate galactose phosphotransferase [Methylophilaceae bacterium]|nr:undecaprenyl-phosphate galactose phosphotransferase [Methylophilaceae bacterium]
MVHKAVISKRLLQRRGGLSNSIQPALDGAAVIGITWGLVVHYIGGFTPDYTILLLLLLGLLAMAYDKFGIYRSNSNFTGKTFNLFKSWSITFLALVVLAFLTKTSEIYSRLLVGQLYLLGLSSQILLHYLVRLAYQKISEHSQQVEKVIIVGQGSLSNYLKFRISNNPWMREQIVGTVLLPGQTASLLTAEDTDAEKPAEEANAILGDIDDLSMLIEKHDIAKVYIVTPLESSDVVDKLYRTLLDKYVSIHWIPDIFSLRLVNHSVKEISGIPVLTLSETPLIGTKLLTKSIVDLAMTVLILAAISPILLAVAIAVKLDSPGPVFFRQKRAGWNGKTFRIWKFRSMYVHQEDGGKLKQAEKNDSRITRVGAFIRKTSLDELPQLFNVLTGDMSLVGPRPHAVQHDQEYSQRIFDYFARHNIKPGITGLAQVRGLRGETKDINQMIQRIEADIEYINNWSVWLDLTVLVRTTLVFTGKNAY